MDSNLAKTESPLLKAILSLHFRRIWWNQIHNHGSVPRNSFKKRGAGIFEKNGPRLKNTRNPGYPRFGLVSCPWHASQDTRGPPKYFAPVTIIRNAQVGAVAPTRVPSDGGGVPSDLMAKLTPKLTWNRRPTLEHTKVPKYPGPQDAQKS